MSHDLAAIGAFGTILVAFIAFISFWWINLRGPNIICSPIRYITIVRAPSSASIILNFILSNIGGSSAVIEYIYLRLKCISPIEAEYRFVPFCEGSIENAKSTVTSLDSPVLPFVVQNGDGKIKEITFTNDLNEFNFSKGEYVLELHISLQPSHVLLRSLKFFITGRQMLDQPLQIKLLEQEFTIVEDLQVKQLRKGMIIDPLKDKLKI
jgi:hypothetical protein